MGDGRRRWVQDRSVRDLSARQRGIRIDLEGDGDQRQAEDDAKDFMVGICRARSRPNRSNISTKPGNTLGACANAVLSLPPMRFPTRSRHASFTSIFPKFSPLKSLRKALGAFSILHTSLPSRIHPDKSRWNSGCPCRKLNLAGN